VEAWCLVSAFGMAGAQRRWWSGTVGVFSVVCGHLIPVVFVCILRSRVLYCRLWQRKFIPAVALFLLVILMRMIIPVSGIPLGWSGRLFSVFFCRFHSPSRWCCEVRRLHWYAISSLIPLGLALNVSVESKLEAIIRD
ncbi:unnamed protein product, partial [Brassica rapa]